MSTVADFNRIEDCDKIDAKCVDAYAEFDFDPTSDTGICLHTPWGGNCLDLTDIVKAAETCTTLYLSPEGNPNCLVYEPECGDNICIHGDDISRIISMQYLKDVSQVTPPSDGIVYMYNESTGLFEPYDLKTTIGNINTIPYVFFEDSVSMDNKLTKHCKEKCMEYLMSLSVDTWEVEISKKSKNYKLLILLEPKVQNAYEAFKNLLGKKVKGEANEFDTTSYNAIRDLALKHKRSLVSTFKNIRDLFCSGNAIMSDNLFKLIGKDLLQYAKIEEKQDALRTIFIPSILDDSANVQLLIKHSELMNKVVSNAEEDSNDFKDKVQVLIDGELKENITKEKGEKLKQTINNSKCE